MQYTFTDEDKLGCARDVGGLKCSVTGGAAGRFIACFGGPVPRVERDAEEEQEQENREEEAEEKDRCGEGVGRE